MMCAVLSLEGGWKYALEFSKRFTTALENIPGSGLLFFWLVKRPVPPPGDKAYRRILYSRTVPSRWKVFKPTATSRSSLEINGFGLQ